MAPFELRPAQPQLEQAVLIQGSPAPVIRGDDPKRLDYFCAVCHRSVILSSVEDGAVWDLVFRCFVCGGLSASPMLSPGHALPPNTVTFSSGRQYLIASTVDMVRGIVLAGEGAVRRRIIETGKGTVASFLAQPNQGRGTTIPTPGENADALDALVARARELFDHVFTELEAVDKKRRVQAKGRPVYGRHRLMEIVEGVRHSARNRRNPRKPQYVDAVSVTELALCLQLLERWQHDPAWTAIRDSSVDSDNFLHNVVTLATASFLADAGNAPELYVEDVHGRRAADLRLAINPHQYCHVEVKCPQKLHHPSKVLSPTTPLTAKEAETIVRRAIHRAGTGAGGQLAHPDGSVLVLGGFHLSDRDLDVLEAAIKRETDNPNVVRPTLAAVAVTTVGTLVLNGVEAEGEVLGAERTSISPSVTVRIVANSRHNGPFSFATEGRADGLSHIERPLKEVVVQGLEEVDPEG